MVKVLANDLLFPDPNFTGLLSSKRVLVPSLAGFLCEVFASHRGDIVTGSSLKDKELEMILLYKRTLVLAAHLGDFPAWINFLRLNGINRVL